MSFLWANDYTKDFMSKGYLQEGQTVEGRVGDIAEEAGRYFKKVMPDFAEKFYNYMGRGFYSLSTPVWVNFGTKRGLPISCNGSYVGDSMESILEKVAEVGVMTKHGAGTSFFAGDLRRRGSLIKSGGVADGPVHYLRLFDAVLNITSQGQVRRGNGAAYLNVEHADIDEFLQIRDVGHKIQSLSIGVTVGDDFINRLPSDVDKQATWRKVLAKRFGSGYPYIMFRDNANNQAPQWYKDKGYKIVASNLCNEIMLPSSEDESFVCNLSSMNLAKWDEWKETDAVEVLTMFLDAVMEEYIQKTEGIRFMEAANKFAKNHRALGVGTLGYHTHLQDKMEPFGGIYSRMFNKQSHRFIKEHSYKASQQMAEWFGEPEVTKGYGMRNATTMALAPTTSSSFILGQVSPSIEPLAANIFTKNLAKGTYVFKSPALERLFEERGMNTDEVWDEVNAKAGSVQHIKQLNDEEKEVFQTFEETSQMDIIQLAADRQKFIDQGQSINLKIHPSTPLKDVNKLVLEGHRLGLKGLYYQRGTNPAQELARSLLDCTVCEA